MSVAISRFKLPETLDDVPEDIREAMLAVQEKAGFVPNVFLMLAHRPDEFRAFLPITMLSWSVSPIRSRKEKKR